MLIVMDPQMSHTKCNIMQGGQLCVVIYVNIIVGKSNVLLFMSAFKAEWYTRPVSVAQWEVNHD